MKGRSQGNRIFLPVWRVFFIFKSRQDCKCFKAVALYNVTDSLSKKDRLNLNWKTRLKHFNVLFVRKSQEYKRQTQNSFRSNASNSINRQMRKGLRTVHTFVTAHTFCSSRDTRVSYGWWLLIQRYFCAV